MRGVRCDPQRMDHLNQKDHSRANKEAWFHRAYEAAYRGYGSPDEAAAKIRQDPAYVMRATSKYFGDVRGKSVANLLGSHGRRAVALSLLGAQVTVVDIAEGNQRYALEMAKAAGIDLNYILSDVLEWPTDQFLEHFDFVLMENGILHYFVDLRPLAALIHAVLKAGGKLILHEFHPINMKCSPEPEGDRLVLRGSYFSDAIVEGPVPYSGTFSEEESESFPLCRYRYWQLGEIVSAIAESGLIIEKLVENPHRDLSRLPAAMQQPATLHLPATFTLVARKGALG